MIYILIICCIFVVLWFLSGRGIESDLTKSALIIKRYLIENGYRIESGLLYFLIALRLVNSGLGRNVIYGNIQRNVDEIGGAVGYYIDNERLVRVCMMADECRIKYMDEAIEWYREWAGSY